LLNGDFETGSFSPWTTTGSASISTIAHGGTKGALVGLNGSATNGDSTVAQTFTASSAGGTLGFWYRPTCKDTVTYDWVTATLKDNTAGSTTTILPKKCATSSSWTQVTTTLVANHSYTVTLVNHDDGYAGDETYTYFDDVTVQ